MRDRDKTKAQLLEELAALREQLASQQAAPAEPAWARADERIPEAAEALLRSSPAAIVAVDRGGRVILWSAAAEHMFGWHEKEVLGRPNPLIPDDAADEFEEALDRQFSGERVVDRVRQRKRRDGSLINVRLSTAPLRDNEGRISGVIALFMPVDHEWPVPPTEAELGRLFDSVNDGVWMMDSRGVTSYVNQRMAEIIGYSVEDMIGQPVRKFLPETEQHRVDEVLRRRAQGLAEGYEVWLPHKQGGGVWCFVSGAPLRDRRGHYRGALATIRDITEHKQMEQMLEQRVQERTAALTEANRHLQEQVKAREQAERAWRESESRFRLLAENATDLICRHAVDGTYLYVSPSSRKLLGYEPEEMIGRSPYEFFHPDDAERIRAEHEEILGWPEASTIEYRIRRRDGTYVWLETVSRAVHDPETGEVAEIHTTSRDITRRIEAEEQLRLVQCAVEQTDEMVIITDSELAPPGPRIEYVNPAFTRVTGYTVEDLAGKTPRILQGPRTSRDVLDRLRKCLSRGEKFEGETYNYRKDGSEFILHWHITPLRDSAGRITHWVSIQRDVTDQRRAEALARQRQNELAHVGRLSTMGEMASGLAHELNQPLAAIVIYAQACLRRMRDTGMEPEELIEALESVKDQAHRASEIIRRLREFVRKREPQRAAADLNHLTREVLGLMEPEVHRHGTSVQLELDENLPPVRVDPVQIEQVILNLVRNAIEAMESNAPNDRPLTIRTYRHDDEHACVSVCDAGAGMSDEQLDRIFEPFFTTKDSGMGMGLNISQSITQANEGRLQANRNPDRGMSFHLILPLNAEE